MAKIKRRTTPLNGNDLISAFGGHPLEVHLPAVHAAFAAGADANTVTLASLAIHDAEQLVAAGNTPENREGLAVSLGVSPDMVQSYIDDAKKLLPAVLVEELEKPQPPLYALGVLTAETSESDEPSLVTAEELVALPPSINLIPLMRPIRNQGQRGTCVSFTATAINEYARALRGGPVDLSEQHLYHEIKLIDGYPNACGTWQSKAAVALGARGQCREVVWSYNPNLPCNNNGVMPANARADAAAYRLQLAPIAPKNTGLIKAALAARKPVGISIPVFNSWYASAETRRSGRITMPLGNEQSVGGHAVCLVGYQDQSSSPGGGYFILRNHWSTSWGYQNPYSAGYGVIPYQYLSNHNTEAYTLASLVADDGNKPEPTPPAQDAHTITIKVKGNVNIVIDNA